MKNYAILFFTLTLFFFTSCVSNNEKDPEKDLPASFEVVSLHLYDSTMNISDADMHAWLNEINAAIEEIGYPGAGYKFWKAIDETIVQNKYMILSSWPGEEEYKLIHDHEAYKAVQEKYSELGGNISTQSLYVKYKLVE
jgi:hypothetical protein